MKLSLALTEIDHSIVNEIKDVICQKMGEDIEVALVPPTSDRYFDLSMAADIATIIGSGIAALALFF